MLINRFDFEFLLRNLIAAFVAAVPTSAIQFIYYFLFIRRALAGGRAFTGFLQQYLELCIRLLDLFQPLLFGRGAGLVGGAVSAAALKQPSIPELREVGIGARSPWLDRFHDICLDYVVLVPVLQLFDALNIVQPILANEKMCELRMC